MSADREVETHDDAAAEDDDHLTDVPDGAGCTEIWEHISERRDGERE